MTLRTGHGNGAGVPRVEVLPADELPNGIPGPPPRVAPAERGQSGRFKPGNAFASLGGKAKANQTKLSSRLGIVDAPGTDFETYKRSAVSFRRAQCAELARTVGGGVCGPAPSSLVASAALQLAWSRYFSDRAARTGDAEQAVTASRLADASRQNLLAAHELCAKEALARGRKPADPLAGYLDAKGTNDG